FITLPSDQLFFNCDVSAKTSSLLHALEKQTTPPLQPTLPLLSGKWHLSGIKRGHEKVFSSFLRFSADGALLAKDIHSLSFSSSLDAYKQQKKWHGSFDLTSSIRRYGKTNWLPIKSSGDFATDGHIEWDFQNLRFSICEYPIEGNLQISFYPLAIQGKLA